MRTQIRVDEDPFAAPSACEREDGAFDDSLSRLVRQRRASIRGVAGLRVDSNAPEKARVARATSTDDAVPR